jgi:uncharacterized membrane protein YfcA
MTLLLTIVIIFSSFIINAFAGFGGGILAVPFLVLLFPLRVTSPFINLLGFSGNILLVKTFYKHIHYRLLIPLVIGNLLGGIIGVHFLVIASNVFLIKLLGIVTLISAIIIFIADKKISFKPNFFIGTIIGLISGILSALFAVGVAPIILYFSGPLKEKDVFRANCLAFFLANAGTQVLLFAIKGLITHQVLLLFLLSLPVILLSIWLGHKIHVKASEKVFRRVVFATLIFSGIVLLIK